jgi:hypothetical protein
MHIGLRIRYDQQRMPSGGSFFDSMTVVLKQIAE